MTGINFMKVSIFLVLAIILVLFFTPASRYLKTLYLIIITSPYERIVENAPEILVLGDSTGYGTGVGDSIDSIAGLIGADYPDYTIKNNSVNGRTIGGLVPVAKETEGEFELILLQIGGNDILQARPVSEVESELRQIIESLADNTENLVMMSSGNVGGASAFSRNEAVKYTALTREFRQMFIEVASSTDLIYVDLFLEPEDDIMSNNPEKYLAVDGLHPSAEGYSLWYKKLQPVVANILK